MDLGYGASVQQQADNQWTWLMYRIVTIGGGQQGPEELRGGLGLRLRHGNPARLGTPTASGLTLPRLREQFAACIGRKQNAGIEPMHGPRRCEDRRQGAGKFRVVRTAVMPKRDWGGRLTEAQHLLHSAIAVGGNHEVGTRNRLRGSWKVEDEVVMKLALLDVIKEPVRSTRPIDRRQKGAESEMRSKRVDRFHGGHYALSRRMVSANPLRSRCHGPQRHKTGSRRPGGIGPQYIAYSLGKVIPTRPHLPRTIRSPQCAWRSRSRHFSPLWRRAR